MAYDCVRPARDERVRRLQTDGPDEEAAERAVARDAERASREREREAGEGGAGEAERRGGGEDEWGWRGDVRGEEDRGFGDREGAKGVLS